MESTLDDLNSFDPFYQQENIVDRIKGILNDYDPSNIFNEFLQNASDAGATECHFQLDMRSFGTEKVFSDQMAAWQGPALIIYNNAEFSDKDFEALCKLGIGNKKDDPSKIGRHGLGFNSVYHFTDVPSIVSGPYIGFFDPQMTNLHKSRDRNGTSVAKGGHRCDFRKLSMETFGDQLKPYMGFFGCDMRSHFKGTLFRIPLRMRPAKSSASKAGVRFKSTAAVAGAGVGGVEWSVGQIQKMMEKWIADAKVGMLFLKNVKTIRISDGFKLEVMVQKELLEPSNPNAPSLPGSVFKIDVSPDVSKPSENVASSQWLVCCDDAFPSDTPSPIHCLAAKRHWSPHCGVAIKFQDTDGSKFHSKLFVHLPTPISTGLPFHIHGDFALTSSRKSLAGSKEEEDEKRIWNSFLMEKCLPRTAIRAMEHLFAMCFLHPSSPGRNRKGFNSATAGYFEHWPSSSTVEFQPFLKAFLRQTYFSRVFPCPGATAVFPMQLKAGCHAILPGPVTIPLELETKVVRWLFKRNRAVCIVPSLVMSVIEAEWSKEPKFSHEQVDGDFIRKSLRETPDYIKNNMKTRAEREWILGWAFQPVITPEVRVSVTSDDIQIIPLLNGEWMRLKRGKKECYVPSQLERSLLKAKDILVDTDVFSTVELDLALDHLIERDQHNVGSLPAEIFATRFLKENPGGVTDQQLKQLWDYLEAEYKYENLDAFYDFPILRTFHGTITTLGKATRGFQISALPSQFFVFMDLLRDLDITVYSSETHRSHKFFKDYCQAYSGLRLLEAIVTHWNDLSTNRVFSMTEAKGMRELVLDCRDTIKSSFISGIGRLPIWTTLGSTDTSPLIVAKGAYFPKGNMNLNKFGAFPTVLSRVDVQTFKSIGAAKLNVPIALTQFVLPKFHDGTLNYGGEIKAAYLDLLSNLFTSSKRKGMEANAAKGVIRTARCYVARDGSFHSWGELFVPGEALTEMMFAGQFNVFADEEMASLMARLSMESNLRSSSSSPDLVVRCAKTLLEEMANGTADQTTTRTRAEQLIQYLYKHPDAGGEDWMDPKWKFVPREANLEWPYDELAPDLPLYMAFSELVGPSTREVAWTQCGFFPAELQPSHAFKARFPTVRTTNLKLPDVLRHLNVLVKDIAPTWKSTEKQLRLKAILLNIYGTIDQYVGSSIKHHTWAVRRATEFLECPYILNGNDKDSSDPSSWLWPKQLMFGIVDDIPPHYAANPVLHQYQNFLIAFGAKKIQPAERPVDVAVSRVRGYMENLVWRCFKTQDQETGFMDVRFEFQKGSHIRAHKIVLATASEFFSLKFKNDWAFDSRWPSDMGVQSICLSSYGDIRDGFWGLLHYFYSDTLIPPNVSPLFDHEDDQGPMGDGESGGKSTKDKDGSSADDDVVHIEILEPVDKLSERLQYLMKIQHVAHRFVATRLKDLIAKELIEGQKVVHSNVFAIRGHAERNGAENVRDHCNKFIENNRACVLEHVHNEIHIVEGKLEALDGQWKGKAGKDTNDDKLGLSESWSDIYGNGGSNDSFEDVDWDAKEVSWAESGRGRTATGYWEDEDEDEDAIDCAGRADRLQVLLNDRLRELQRNQKELLIEP
ncbi:hypothetical protein KI688_007725 [Linnemannia hyalina]|uniref:BTB domain-containing protein n=1 Tax=Linnemannia hyalina TaxID=64524 RepID=A0A9P7XKF2_9FUNG|nr:hypothetical protein KI688_007725 [Linnemannia hyalina]